jgi:hypothetical protein
MKKLFFVLIFIGNTALGWLIHAGARAENPQQSAQTSSAQRELATRTDRAKEAREREFKNLAKQFLRMNSEDQSSLSKNVPPQDRIALVETLLKEGDPSGTSSDSYLMITYIIRILATEDFEGAWAWSQQIANDAHRRYVSAEILEKLAEKDLTRALALCSEISKVDPLFQSGVGLFALEKTASKNASDFLEVLTKLNLSDKSSGFNFEFAKDFDFQKVAEGTSALLRKQKKLPHAFPCDFISFWGERDPDAAFAWLATEEQNDSFSFEALLEGVERQGIPGAASAWVVRKIEESEKFRKLIVEGLNNASAASINSIVKALPISNNSDRFLTELFIQQCEYSQDHFETLLGGMSSPKARLEAFLKVKKGGRDISDKMTEAQCQVWGITKQQFEAIFPPRTEY